MDIPYYRCYFPDPTNGSVIQAVCGHYALVEEIVEAAVAKRDLLKSRFNLRGEYQIYAVWLLSVSFSCCENLTYAMTSACRPSLQPQGDVTLAYPPVAP
jgi:hypothetical protein